MTELERAIQTFELNVADIKAALAGDVHGYIHVWPKHWLGVKINNDVCHVTSAQDATVVSGRDKRKFYNGARERATLMLREKALCGALVHAVSILETFQSMNKELA
jgi:hypothetical protein